MNPIKPETHLRKTPRFLLLVLAFQTFSTFMSETKFLPIRNNVGLFEISAVVLIVAVFAYFSRNRITFKFHPIIAIVALWFLDALFSLQLVITPEAMQFSIVNVIILAFELAFLIAVWNLLLLDKHNLRFLLRVFLLTILVVGAWVLIDQVASGGDYSVAGPFRNRSHMGLYMFGAFWFLLLYNFWPGINRWERWLMYPALSLTIYTIAVSLRQSIYTAFVTGLAGLVISFVFLQGRRRFNLSFIIIGVAVMGILLFTYGPVGFAPLDLFRREFSGVGARLQQTTALNSEDDPAGPSFDVMQRTAALKAFQENPIFGIGWMGFYHSIWSPTGNELHSTPWRFLAELGSIGFLLYLAYVFILLSRAFRLFLAARSTPYQLSTFVLFIGFLSYFVDHYYNRMFTDRPYWFMLVIFLAFESLVLNEVRAAKPQTLTARVRRKPAPIAAESVWPAGIDLG
jgi:O-antigen ligase